VLAAERRREVADATGLSFVKVKALRRLTGVALSQRALAAALTTDPPYVTVVVRDLERRGLVTRRPSPDDRRVRLVSVTPAGRAVARQAERILDRPPDWLASLTAAERAVLARALAAGR
jgi:DNA-binding MarR family transcriptional regulator